MNIPLRTRAAFLLTTAFILLPTSASAWDMNTQPLFATILETVGSFAHTVFSFDANTTVRPPPQRVTKVAAQPAAAGTTLNTATGGSAPLPVASPPVSAHTTQADVSATSAVSDADTPTTSPTPQPRTIYLQPQIIERTTIAPTSNTVSANVLAQVLASFEASINDKIGAITKPAVYPQQVAAGGSGVLSYGTSGGGGVSLAQVNSAIASAIQGAFASVQSLVVGAMNATSATIASLSAENATTTTLYVAGNAAFGSPLSVSFGGTGVGVPGYGQILLGQANGTYALVSTSSLGITGGSGGSGTVSTGSQGQFAFYNANGTILTATSSLFLAQNGNVGIGTTSPTAALSIAGNISTPNATGASVQGVWYQNGSPFLYEFAYGYNGTVTTAGRNIFLGANAGNFSMGNTGGDPMGGSENTGIGDLTLHAITSGAYNIAIGTHAQQYLTTGSSNVSVGVDALTGPAMTGSANVAIGTDGLMSDTSGFNNTAVGDHSLAANTTGFWNTGLGGSSLSSNQTGNYNTAVGMLALHQNVSGSNSVALGQAAGYNETNSNQFYVGNVQQATLANDRTYSLMWGTFSGTANSLTGQQLVINGKLGIATTSPDTLLTVGSSVPVGSVAHFQNSTGSCYINPTNTALSCSSDVRLKTNINPLASSTLEALLTLNPVTYKWKTESATTSPHTGFIAQEVQTVFPDLVSQGPDGYYTLNYAGLTPYLVKAVQEVVAVSGAFKTNLISWFASASNGITDFYTNIIHANEAYVQKLCTTRSDGTQVCVTNDQLAALLAGAAGGTPAPSTGTPSTPPAASTTPPSLTVNGHNPAHWTLNQLWKDNLGATFMHGAVTETIYSTSTVDTTVPGTTTIDYWATYYPDPTNVTTLQMLHAAREVVVDGALGGDGNSAMDGN